MFEDSSCTSVGVDVEESLRHGGDELLDPLRKDDARMKFAFSEEGFFSPLALGSMFSSSSSSGTLVNSQNSFTWSACSLASSRTYFSGLQGAFMNATSDSCDLACVHRRRVLL